MILKPDCRHFPGDRPCQFNKTQGLICDGCSHYEKFKERILIIKLDAVGDVLRTTSLLPSIKAKYPDSHITWVTRKNAISIFRNDPYVNRTIAFEDTDSVLTVMTEEFDLLYHPDASKLSAKLAESATSKLKLGYGISKEGVIYPYNAEAEEWYEMGAFDNLKKKNTKTYQQIIHEICRIEFKGGEIRILLSAEENEFAIRFADKYILKRFSRILGLNTGAGGRWELKQWRFEGYVDLLNTLKSKQGLGILLYGGPEEEERNEKLSKLFPNVINTGSKNELRTFFSLVNLCDDFITGDTLGLHAATALKKNIICLFGPTSFNEIYDYGRIIKIIPDMDCLVCYKMKCDFAPNCMDKISTEEVLTALARINPIYS